MTKKTTNTHSIDNAISIELDLTLTGQGIVNFGGSDDRKNLKWASKREDGTYGVTASKNDNVKYGKFNAVLKDDGSIEVVPKISSGCIRNAIFGSRSSIMIDDTTWVHANATELYLLRGDLYADGGVRKKGAVTVGDAIKGNGAIPVEETCTRSGVRDSNSMFSVETLGDTVWNCRIILSIPELAFISLSDVQGRRAVPHGLEHMYADCLGKHFDFPAEITPYIKADSTTDVPETGILLDDKAVTKCVNYLLDRIYRIKILRANSYAEFSSVRMKVNRGGENIFNPVCIDLKPGDSVELTNCVTEYTADPEHAKREQEQLAKVEEKLKKAKEKKEKKTEADKGETEVAPADGKKAKPKKK